MKIDGFWTRALRSPDVPAAGAPPAETPPATPPADAAPATPPAETPPATPPAGTPPPDAGAGRKWYEHDGIEDDDRSFLTKKGLATDDADAPLAKLIKGWRSAEKHLGKAPDSIMDRPAKDQSLGEYLRQHGDVFGVPKTADEYQIAKPELPKGVEWNADLEAAARTVAHEQGMSQAAFQSMVDVMTASQIAEQKRYDDGFAAANQAMTAELTKEWGAQYAAKAEQARRALAHIGERAGLSADQMLDATTALEAKTGSASLLKLFATIADGIGEDSLVTGSGGGAGSTPAEARQELELMKQPDSDYQKAIQSGDRAMVAKLNERRAILVKIATGGK